MILDLISLSHIGFSNYSISGNGRVYKTAPSLQEIKTDNQSRFYLVDDCGNRSRITQKTLVRKALDKEFCIDTIENKPLEEWKVIPNTNGKYFISNCGRVKSYCGYQAIVLNTYQKQNGYLIVKINGRNVSVHRLVAFAFCENKYIGQQTEIHHKDFNRTNNAANNLEILSIAEHHKRHAERKSEV